MKDESVNLVEFWAVEGKKANPFFIMRDQEKTWAKKDFKVLLDQNVEVSNIRTIITFFFKNSYWNKKIKGTRDFVFHWNQISFDYMNRKKKEPQCAVPSIEETREKYLK